MKTAFAHWNHRIAPVFDIARQVYLVETEAHQLVHQTQELLVNDPPVQKVAGLVSLGVQTLVCGAISRPLHGLVAAYGIQVIPFVAGDLQEVTQAWIAGRFDWRRFAMPGCSTISGRRFRGQHGRFEEGNQMMGRNRASGAGGGKGLGRGQGQGGPGLGRMGGSQAAGVAGDCVCPQCGHKQPHERGNPCFERLCPKCGIAMTRS